MTKKRIQQVIYIGFSSILVVMIMGFLGQSDTNVLDQENKLKYNKYNQLDLDLCNIL